MYDAIIVGARVAGAPTAMLLARRGLRVLLVDRATFPSPTINGHFIHPPGVERLRAWGVLDDVVVAAGCPPVTRWTFDAGELRFEGAPPAVAGHPAVAYAPRREPLDAVLLRAARAAGAEVREGFAVTDVLVEDGRVAGVRGTWQGAAVTERARLVVGADGARSAVARAVDAEEYEARPTLSCAYYGYWAGTAVTGAQVHVRERRVVIAMPVTDELAQIYVAWPSAEFHEVKRDVEGAYRAAVELVPELADAIRDRRPEGRIVGSGVLPNHLRRPVGPGWALVGDAGYVKDPYLAQGITDAFASVDLLARAAGDGLLGLADLDEALEGYHRERDAVALPRYELDLAFASLEPPPPPLQALLAALPGDDVAIERFWGVLMSVLPPAALAPPAVA